MKVQGQVEVQVSVQMHTWVGRRSSRLGWAGLRVGSLLRRHLSPQPSWLQLKLTSRE